MRIDVVTLFPGLVEQVAAFGVVGRAAERGLFELHCWNPRDHARDRQRSVDDRPYGGGPGMLMKVQPLADAIAALRRENGAAPLVYLSPQGRRVEQAMLARQVERGTVALLCGRYEGIDQRLIEREVDDEWSLGDFVISGGELAAMVCIDAMVRLLPGALGDAASAASDSFSGGLLKWPQYTRPEVYRGERVPAVLLGGNHREIAAWREREALERTWRRRPELLDAAALSAAQRALLNELRADAGSGRRANETDEDGD